MDGLSSELIIDILSRLPIKSLLRCRCVCKFWLRLTHDSTLVDKHFFWSSQSDSNLGIILKSSVYVHTTHWQSRLYFLENNGSDDYYCANINFSLPYFRNYEVKGSCNGLLVLFDPLVKSVTYIYNPCSGEYMNFPKFTRKLHTRVDFVVGFGYSAKRNVYKVVEIASYGENLRDNLQSEVHVCTLGDSSWRYVGNAPYFIRKSNLNSSDVLVNGALHWLSLGYEETQIVDNIVAFDMDNEEFKIIPHPDFESRRIDYTLGILRGCLSSTSYKYHDFVEVWVMNEYGVKESWIMCFKIVCSEVALLIGPVQPLCFQKNGEVLLLYGSTLLSYNVITRKLKELRVAGLPRSFEAFPHLGTLLSPGKLFKK